MKKRTFKKLTLNKESLIRLDPSELREVGGRGTQRCTTETLGYDTCAHCTGASCLC
jgi:hypothetical protein